MAVATEMGVDFTEVRYMKDFPDEQTLRDLIAKLEEPVENLVRKDAQFAKLGLNEDDYVGNADAVVEVLGKYHRLLQRPILVGDDKAIIGRPFEGVMAKTRVAEMVSSSAD
ncbi:MAG: arsenate reductase [Acidimicrobiaceae bacterium]|nr:arsenate reductase [Acidimicrobiaceae bacterium]MXW77340.1 arsenate reductase [Acidimicrobiaceae bacterium]MYA75464.1 arsenate reductase [Acidimicrobiaceae bacterium]MYC43622.1 arsenate reductase [Acidimicrobiaceae bacterium]MYD06495.1 arsenate reductase [Acidimicrobiaceae bacterium]